MLVAFLGTSTGEALSMDDRQVTIEALHDLVKAIDNFKQCLDTHDLLVVHNYDNTLRLINTLYQKAGLAKENEDDLKSILLHLSTSAMTFHAASDASDQMGAEMEFTTLTDLIDKLKSFYPPDLLEAAMHLPDKYICPMHADVIGLRGDSCPKCGMSLEQAGAFSETFIHMPPIQARVRTDVPLKVGAQVHALIYLTQSDGSPVRLGDLKEMHTQKIHLFIIDSSLTDYHHEHPAQTDSVGVYSFKFTPRKSGSYRVWADLVPVITGRQEYAMTDIRANAPGEQLSDTSVVLSATVEGLTYALQFDEPNLRVGKPTRARLHIAQKDATPFTQLEPIMAAFAHLVGFNENRLTIMHIHPIGTPPQSPSDRGGPELEFFIYPTQAGFMRLFAQVQIGGVSKFAPFGVCVLP